MDTLYEHDVIAWAERQAALLRSGQWAQLDMDNLIAEVEDVGNRERQALRSHLVILLVHLLKWQFQPARRSRSWTSTIVTQRAAVEEALEDYPSLNPLLDNAEWMSITYARAVRRARAETGLPRFPAFSPWSRQQLLDMNYLPS